MEAENGKREAGSIAARKAIQHYRDIEAYQRAKELLAPVHALARRLPREEQYELASQIRRASTSILANIAEGYGTKRSPAKFRSFRDIALGSANEMIVHLEVGHAIGYFEQGEVDELIERYETVAKQLYRLAQSWQDFTNNKTRIIG